MNLARGFCVIVSWMLRKIRPTFVGGSLDPNKNRMLGIYVNAGSRAQVAGSS